MAGRGPQRSSGGAFGSPERPSSDRKELSKLVASLPDLDRPQLLLRWRNHLGGTAPAHVPGWLLARLLVFRLQAQAFGDVSAATLRRVRRGAAGGESDSAVPPFANRTPATRDGVDLRPGAMLTREWRGKLERVTALEVGFAWNGKTFGSLSQVAKAITGTSWNGHRFFGLRSGSSASNTTTKSGARGARVSDGATAGALRSKASRRGGENSEAAR